MAEKKKKEMKKRKKVLIKSEQKINDNDGQ